MNEAHASKATHPVLRSSVLLLHPPTGCPAPSTSLALQAASIAFAQSRAVELTTVSFTQFLYALALLTNGGAAFDKALAFVVGQDPQEASPAKEPESSKPAPSSVVRARPTSGEQELNSSVPTAVSSARLSVSTRGFGRWFCGFRNLQVPRAACCDTCVLALHNETGTLRYTESWQSSSCSLMPT